MVTLLKNGNEDWRAWALSIAVAIISGLVLAGVANLTYQFNEIKQEVRIIAERNHQQDLCIKELQVNQNERLERERREGIPRR